MEREEVLMEKKCDAGHLLVKVWLTGVDRSEWVGECVFLEKENLTKKKKKGGAKT